MGARKMYNVTYPQLYHKDPNHIFNCYQVSNQLVTEVLSEPYSTVRTDLEVSAWIP